MAITTNDFEYLRFLVRNKSGIALESDKQYLTETRLMPIVRQEGIGTVEQLLAAMRREQPSGRLHTMVTEAFATKETYFFRDTFVFEALEKLVLPDIINNKRSLAIWSAACSSGQEPYTIAMILAETFPFTENRTVKIIASDFSKGILDRARKGNYTRVEISRGLSSCLQKKYFQKQGLTWQINNNIRKKVEFRNINLLEVWPPLPDMDVIFLRNVLIYFDINNRKMILEKVLRVLKPGGWLFVGTAETPNRLNSHFEQIRHGGAVIYRRKMYGANCSDG
ncbi:protein-glutamate O-methyltransferase CheR [Desulfococcaceae bacterium HSG7]|nr:protein-glutamate O-methyltransferase CheR [Desulfococcaceae bacterium HSG7]